MADAGGDFFHGAGGGLRGLALLMRAVGNGLRQLGQRTAGLIHRFAVGANIAHHGLQASHEDIERLGDLADFVLAADRQAYGEVAFQLADGEGEFSSGRIILRMPRASTSVITATPIRPMMAICLPV